MRTITAVALNPALDRTLLVPGFRVGTTARITSSRLDPGGKGINVARALRGLGAPVRVVGFLGEEDGHLIAGHLERAGIAAAFVPVPGATRVNLKIIDPDTRTLTEINDAGFSVAGTHLDRLVDLIRPALTETDLLVLTGSLPPGAPPAFYGQLIALAAAAGVSAILDADGDALAQALPARPALVKPNQAEAERVLGRPLPTRADLAAAAAELLQRGAGTVVLSAGAAGAALVSPTARLWATPPAIRPGSAVGAGDSMVAALSLALVRGLPAAEALRLAVAAGAAAASREGTQVCTRADVEALLPHVALEVLAAPPERSASPCPPSAT